MKISLALFMLVLAFVLEPCRSSGQTAAPPFSIAISTDTPTVKVGADLSLKVHITNTSDHDINVSSSYFEGADASYRQDVRDSRGNLPKRAVREMSTRTSGNAFEAVNLGAAPAITESVNAQQGTCGGNGVETASTSGSPFYDEFGKCDSCCETGGPGCTSTASQTLFSNGINVRQENISETCTSVTLTP